MNDIYYDMIFKRKSFHKFPKYKPLTQEELAIIKEKLPSFKPLYEGIKVSYDILPCKKTHYTKGEYEIKIYSDVKDGYLENIGYIGEEIDLWLTSMNIGVCWYGFAMLKSKKKDNVEFVISIIIGKVSEDSFRSDFRETKRKEVGEIWKGDKLSDIASIVRYTPSSRNAQPWSVEVLENTIKVYRIKPPKKVRKIPIFTKLSKVDIGIFALFLEVCLEKKGYEFSRLTDYDKYEDDVKELAFIYRLEFE